jgi:diguanylate cyclase (GGDEF)-like protein
MSHIDKSALDLFMPMHLIVDADGVIASAGPTLCKLRQDADLIGGSFHQIFELRCDGSVRCGHEIPTEKRLNLTFKEGRSIPLKGIAAPMNGGRDILLNLSFGISIVDAVGEYRLTAGDFAHTDLAIEMLYLVEAKSAVLEETKQLNARLQGAKVAAEEQAFTDTLTGLKNRRAMDHVLERMTQSKMPFALMHLDLDYFKDVNDTFGHAAGDAVLQRVAQVLVEETRTDDLVARVGGDEFVLVLNGLVNETRLLAASQRMIAQLEVPVLFQNQTCRISGSIGITTTDFYETVDIEQMSHDADTALYDSKHKGRACATFFDPKRHGDVSQRVGNAAV